MNSTNGSALIPPCAGWISFHRSHAKMTPDPPQRSAANRRRPLMASRVSRQSSVRDGCSSGPPCRLLYGWCLKRIHIQKVSKGVSNTRMPYFSHSREQIIPVCDHAGRPATGSGFKVAAADLGVLQHQPHHRHAMPLQVLKVVLDDPDVTSAVERPQLFPAHRIVLSDRVPSLPIVCLKVRHTWRSLHPEKIASFRFQDQSSTFLRHPFSIANVLTLGRSSWSGTSSYPLPGFATSWSTHRLLQRSCLLL